MGAQQGIAAHVGQGQTFRPDTDVRSKLGKVTYCQGPYIRVRRQMVTAKMNKRTVMCNMGLNESGASNKEDSKPNKPSISELNSPLNLGDLAGEYF
jgi:hypothetical protein